MTDETKDEFGVVHPAKSIEVAHHHFNILKVLRDAKAEFEAKNPGKIAAYFYAPEPVLYLIDRAVKSKALTVAPDITQEILDNTIVTQAFGMELISISGTCITVTAEAIHDDESERQAVAMAGPADQLPN
jgi:hypothetical protein